MNRTDTQLNNNPVNLLPEQTRANIEQFIKDLGLVFVKAEKI